MSVSDLVVCAAGAVKGSTSVLAPEELDNPTTSENRPPLPPKRRQRSPAFEKTCQDPQVKVLNVENKPLNSLASHVPDGVKGNNRCLDRVPGEAPAIHNIGMVGILPKAEPKCQTHVSPHVRPPVKPPRHNKAKRAETEGGKQNHEAPWSKPEEKMEDEKKQGPTDRHEKTGEREETPRTESRLSMGQPSRQILVIFTDMEKGGEKGEDRRKEDKGPNVGLTTPPLTEDSLQLAMKCSDLASGEKLDMATISRNCTSAVSAKPEPTVPSQPPPRPERKCPPRPPIKPPQLLSAIRAGIEEDKERRMQNEEQWSDKDLMDKRRDEKDGEGKDRRILMEDTQSTMTKMSSQQGEPNPSMNQGLELPRDGQRFCLMPPCRNRPTSASTAKDETLYESQLPGKEHQIEANGQIQTSHLSQGVPAQIKPTGTDPNMETLKWTENNKEIQMSGKGAQDSEEVSRSPSRHREGIEVVETKMDPSHLLLKRLEDAQEDTETPSGGEIKPTSQKTLATREKMKKFAKKVIVRMTEGREEKKRNKVVETETDGLREDDNEFTRAERTHGDRRGMKDEEKEEGVYEVAVDQLAVTETETYVGMMGRRITRRYATSGSPFSSFKVCSPVKLVDELLSADEWSQFLCTDQPDPPSCQTDSEDTGLLSVNCSAEPDLPPDVFEGNHAAVPEEHEYEYIDMSNIISEERRTQEQQEMDRTCISAIPKMLQESENNQMSPRTNAIYETVFIQPVQPTYVNVSENTSQMLLDSTVQKYLIKLSKEKKRRPSRKRGRNRNNAEKPSSSTSPQQVFLSSVFYNVPAAGGEEQVSAIKAGGSSPKPLAKIKMALKDKTMLRPAQPKEDRGK